MAEHQAAYRKITTPDRHHLAVEVTGAPHGLPVFLMHGTPGSRRGIKPRGIVLYRLGVKLICYDRPGYGHSSRRKGRRVVDAAKDVEVIADALGIDQFAVIGRSGGAPHALAAAAELPDRVTRAAALVSVAPVDAIDLDWYHGMGESNIDEYERADADDALLAASLTARADAIRNDPETLVKFLDKELSETDRRVLENVAMRRQITDSYREAVRYGAHGWIDDALAFRREWGFDPASIQVPVRLWHGAVDQFSPVGHTLWLAAQIPGAEPVVQPREGHFAAVEILPEMLTWVTAPNQSQGQPGTPAAAGRADGQLRPAVRAAALLTTDADRAPDKPIALRSAR